MSEKIKSLKFYTDTHIAKAVTVQLREKGIDIVRCEEVGMAEATDLAHLEYATEQGRILISHDSDFLALHSEWQSQNREHTGIVRASPEIQHKNQVGKIVSAIMEFQELVELEAASIDDFYNQIQFIR